MHSVWPGIHLAILPSFFKLCGKLFQPGIFIREWHIPIYRALKAIINLRIGVDLWRNDEFIGSQDIVFESTTENTGDKSGGLMPCLTRYSLNELALIAVHFPS